MMRHFVRTTMFAAVALVMLMGAGAERAAAIDIFKDLSCSAGTCQVDGYFLAGGPVGGVIEANLYFNDMKVIRLADANFPTTTIEFGIGNAGNNVALDYRIVFDLLEMDGSLITTDQLVVQGTAAAGVINAINLDLSPLPNGAVFHGFRVAVETMCAQAGACTGFDLSVAGGGGDPLTAVSGPIVFNRAFEDVWVPEPSSCMMLLLGAAAAAVRARRRGPA